MRGNKTGIRIICLACCVMLAVLSGLTGMVQASSLAFDLNALGITSGFDVENRLDSYVTRGEMAQLLVNMMNQKAIAVSMESADYFDDVAASPYKGAINLLYELHIISGTGERTFEPDRYVRYTEGCKMFVNALGYNNIISSSDLASYTFMAGTIGVTDGVDSSQEYLTFQNVLIMLNNALDIGKMVPMYYNTNVGASYEVQEDNTFRNDLANASTNGYVKMRGIVTADVSTYLLTQRNAMKESQIEVDGKVFDYDGTAPLGLVGMEVEMYVSTVDSEYDKIVSMTVTGKNNVTEVSGDDVETFSGSALEYFVDDRYTGKVQLHEGTKYIYNNNIDRNFSPDQLNYDNVITIRAIDNDNDGVADVVFVFEYVDRIVEAAYADQEIVVLTKEYQGAKNLLLGEDDTTAYVEYYDANGNKTDFSAIEKDAVLSIATSKDGYNVRIVVSKERVKGFVEAKSDDYITVSGTAYTYIADVAGMRLGSNVELWLNFRGDIIDYEEVNSSTDFAYVYGTELPKNGLGDVKVKLLIPGVVATKTLEGEFDEESNSTATVTNLYVNNADVLVYYLANKVSVGGTSYSAADAVDLINQQAVRYYLNSDGQINKLDFVEPNGTGGRERMYYNSSEKIFGTSGSPAFGLDDKTVAVCLPVSRNGNTVTVEMLSDTELLNFKMELMNARDSYVAGYEVDEDTHIAPFVVIEQLASSMQVGNPGTLIANKKNVGLVTKAAREYNEDTDESVIKFTMLTIGEQTSASEQTFYVSDVLTDTSMFEAVSKGDLVLYSLDNFGRMDNVTVLQDFDNYDADYDIEEAYCYTVQSIDFDEINNQRRRWVDVLSLCSSSDPNTTVRTFDLLQNASLSPVVFLLDSQGGGRIGSVEDIRVNDRVFVYYPSAVGDVTAIVIKR